MRQLELKAQYLPLRCDIKADSDVYLTNGICFYSTTVIDVIIVPSICSCDRPR